MSLFALILSACVGAITLPAGTIAESKTEKTESETKTPKKLVIEEPEPQDKKVVETVEPKPIISVEPKPISANPCLTNPFGDTCGGAEFNDAREAICLTERESHRCRVIIPLVCIADSLDKLCADDETYYPAQYATCMDDKTNPRCTLTITRVCGADSLDTLCNEITEYFPVQKIACATEPNSVRCRPTITRVCRADVLNPYCSEAKNYFTAQKVACRRDTDSERCTPTITRVCTANIFDSLCKENFNNARELICAGEPRSNRCRPTIARVCGANIFNSLCKENFNNARELICAGESNSNRCAPTIVRVCDADSLDRLCNGLTAYFPMQRIACESGDKNRSECSSTIARICGADKFDSLCGSNYNYARKNICSYESNSERCVPTIRRVCGANAFDTLCGSNYDSAREMVCIAEPNSPRCYPTLDRVCGVNAFGTLCQLSNLTLRHLPARPNNRFNSTRADDPSAVCNPYCTAYIPDIINIKPLNNANTGTATYTGAFSFHSTLHDRNSPALTQIDIIADFDNNTLSYSGNVGYDEHIGYYGDNNPRHNFHINGTFTDRGILTGNVSFNLHGANLIGLIGQDEAIGVFASIRASRFSGDEEFAGGFRVLREK